MLNLLSFNNLNSTRSNKFYSGALRIAFLSNSVDITGLFFNLQSDAERASVKQYVSWAISLLNCKEPQQAQQQKAVGRWRDFISHRLAASPFLVVGAT